MKLSDSGIRVPGWFAAAVMLASIGLCLWLNNGFLHASWAEIGGNLFPPFWRMTGAAFVAHATALAEAAWLCAAFCGAGCFLIERLGLELDDAWEHWALSFGLGLGAWGTALLFLGLAGLFYRPLLMALTVPSVLPLWRRVRRKSFAENAVPAFGLIGKVCAAFFAFLLLTSLPNLLAPETFYDALIYHLALPDLYLQHHRIVPTPYNLYSGIPSLPQMTFAAALAWDRWAVVARLVHFSLIPALAAAYVAAARRWGRPDAGPLAACLFFSAPVVFYEGGQVTVGAESALFQFLSFYCFVVACGRHSPSRRRWFVLAGLFLGFALSTKYTAWILPAAFLFSWIVSARRQAAPRARELAAVFLVAAAVTAPWIIRNVAFYRDPLYPYLSEAFHVKNAEYIHTARWSNVTMGQDPVRILTEPAKLASYLRLPWDMSLNFGRDNLAYPGPAFLMLLPALFLVCLPGPVAALSVLALGAWAGLGLLTFLPRYFIPTLAVVVLPLAWAACSLRPRWLKACVAAAVLATGAANVLPFNADTVRSAVWPVVLGLRSRRSFLSHAYINGYPTPSYAGFRYLNEHAPADAKVLLFGDGRSFYLDRDSSGSSVFNAGPLEIAANESADAAALRDKLSTAGFSYVLVNRGESVRTGSPFAFTDRGRAVAEEFSRKYLLKVFETFSQGDRWVAVYRLMGEAEASLPHPPDDSVSAHRFNPGAIPSAPIGDD